MQDRKRLEEQIEQDAEISSLKSDLDTLFELAREGEDMAGEIERAMQSFQAKLDKLETKMLLSGENAGRSAIMTIHPGAGRHRKPGLGRDADAHVPALRGTQRL